MSEPRGRILLAEDSLVGQRVGLAMLENLGYAVEVVGDGACAVRAATTSDFDLVLMKCRMPILDGYRAAAKIRKAATAHMPIIAVASDATKRTRARCRSAGMDDCVTKPLTVAGLSELLARWVPAIAGPVPDAPQADSVAEPLDPKVISELERLGAATGEDVLGELVVMFVDDAAGRAATLHTALDTGDAKVLAFTAHTLAGSASGLGARELRERCIALEEGGTKAQLAAVDAELGRVCGALSGMVPAA
ncbi:MAG: hypothetical protein QOI80_2280 [Solirubrobacteraceae bacterium]|jgi:CheY-like chemotaxis protein/HPt (histidine-containing phosphotransfer) domain-containing protein|nr:hypothetical protein [Solirubrobacteraceae bacterium]